ncbi:MAG: UDP-N-acetylglucosamine 2-epimerase [Candidatus Ozemobacter sibiricus]|uniref:UDP-N-acetylglucosamine 2-epimerase (non-hydrolyzing) n=1 Tax=Candidatus Ozemobacter sibiricus TaxID=2268124 RepID=A0A367ZK49_9BACT|nr:MAG: UDP-N-acetylglucosamine 2-epimerase [Candidatus Ozemobacter sibiricus]
MAKRLLFVLGTRPEIIKLAPVIRCARATPGLEAVVVHTGQHRELAAEMFQVFDLRPDHDLAVMEPDQTLFSVSARILDGLARVFQQETVDLVVVQGDTTSAFLGALAGYYSHIPVAHVEAGLRTNDKFSPFPEEMNRRLAGTLADLHFPPTARARANLVREGVADRRILVTGNTVIDALLWALELPHTPSAAIPDLKPGERLVLVTTHRRESFGEPHLRVFRALRELVDRFPEVRLLFPVHPNPNVRAQVGTHLGDHPRIHLCAPLGYLDFLHAMKRSFFLLSDSGGVQEEAPTLKKPVLVLRDVTERPEGLESGALQLVGTDPEKILGAATALLTDPAAYAAMTKNPNPYGDGKASERIIERILAFLGPPG